MVTKPQNVLVLRDVHCARYVAGGNTKFFGTAAAGTNALLPQHTKSGINTRLSFNDEGGDYESMLCFGLDADQLKRMSSRTSISLSDRVLPWDTSPTDTADQGGFPISTIDRAAMGLNTIHYGQVNIEAT